MFFCTGAPKGSTGSGSGFKVSQKTGPQGSLIRQTGRSPEIKRATPGLPGIDLSPTPRQFLIVVLDQI